jgi:siroheme synthase-like protein
VARRKASGLLAAGAIVTVVAPEICDSLSALAGERLTLVRRPYRADDLDGQTLVFGALDDADARAELARGARERGIPANLADDPVNCDFILPSLLRRGDLMVTVCTGGRSPALARKLRLELEEHLGPELARQVALLGEVRERLMSRFPDDEARRRAVLLQLVNSDDMDLIPGDEDRFHARVDELIEEHE